MHGFMLVYVQSSRLSADAAGATKMVSIRTGLAFLKTLYLHRRSPQRRNDTKTKSFSRCSCRSAVRHLWEAFSSQNHNTCGLFFSRELRVNLLPLWHSTLYHLHVLNCCKTFFLNICKSFCLYSPLEQQLDPDSRGTLQCQSLRPP